MTDEKYSYEVLPPDDEALNAPFRERAAANQALLDELIEVLQDEPLAWRVLIAFINHQGVG